MQWTPQQDAALKAVDSWIKDYYTTTAGQQRNKKQIFRLFGYAGTGKTTLARHFAESLDGGVCYGAYTGKAAVVMRKNGCVGARTIHSMIYVPEVDDRGEVTFRLNSTGSVINDCSLIVIDEVSMVDEEIGKDLLSFGKPILVLGDPAQLPPVKGTGFFTESEQDIMLTDIRRQAKDDPIIYIATELRNGNFPDIGDYGDSRIVSKIATKNLVDVNQVLVGRNATRENLNQKIRKILGYESEFPVVGEKLICLKNDSKLGIFNGGMFNVKQNIQKKYKTNFLHMILQDMEFEYLRPSVKVHKSFFVDEVETPDWKALKDSQSFSLAHAITVHKSQGSQWDSTLVYGNEAYCFRDDKWRWLYTAATRSINQVVLLKD
jgi:exodeoxyribonuclease-5